MSPTHRAHLRLDTLPRDLEARRDWFRAIASDVAASIIQCEALGASVGGLNVPFTSFFSGELGAATLEAGQRSGEIVYHDRSLAGTRHEYLLLPELLAARITYPRKLKANQLVEWRIRLLAHAHLLTLPEVALRPLPEMATPATICAYEGLRLLFACRWYLEAGEPIPYSASFIVDWCGITRWQAVSARDCLRRHVLDAVETRPTPNFPVETQFFLPRPITERVSIIPDARPMQGRRAAAEVRW